MNKHHLLTLTSLLTLTCSLNAASRIEKRTEHAKGAQSQQNLVLHDEEQALESMIASSSSKNEKSNYSIPQNEASVPSAPRTPQPSPAPEPPSRGPSNNPPPPPEPAPRPTPRTPPASVPQRSQPPSPQPPQNPPQSPQSPPPPSPPPQPTPRRR